MKKRIALLLLLTMLFTLAACGEKPAEPTPAPEPVQTEPVPAEPVPTEPAEPEIPALATIPIGELPAETIEQALAETAMAYWRKNPYMQYDTGFISSEPSALGGHRRTLGQTPEDTCLEREHFSQCTAFGWEVWYEATGLDFIGAHASYQELMYDERYAPCVLTGFDSLHPESVYNNAEAALQYLTENARPGDLVLGRNSSANGHCMVVVGDVDGDGRCDMLHSWPLGGGSGFEANGSQGNDPNGAGILQSMQDLLLEDGHNPSWYLGGDRGYRWWLFRPQLLDECKALTLTPAAATRVEHPGMEITKTADRLIYDSVQPGENLVITQVIANHGTEKYENLKVYEYIPEGASLVSADSACTVQGQKLCWVLSIPAGNSVTLTWTVRCDLGVGDLLTFPNGWVGAIPTRTLSFGVGGKTLTESQQKAMDAVASGILPESLQNAETGELDFVNVFYREILGAEAKLPATTDEFFSAILTTVKPLGMEDKLLTLRDETQEPDARLTGLLVNKMLGGMKISFGKDFTARLFSMKECYLTPGDVAILCEDAAGNGSGAKTTVHAMSVTFCIYLGNGQVLAANKDGIQNTTYEMTFDRMLKKGVFAVLRPTQGGEDLSAQVGLPQLPTAEVSDEAAFRAAAEGSAMQMCILSDLTLPQSMDLSAKRIVLAPGVKLDLGQNSLSVRSLTMEEGATFTASGSGRLTVLAGNEEETAAQLLALGALPAAVQCRYLDADIAVTFDCVTKTASWPDCGSGTPNRKNMEVVFRCAPEGWTLKMPCTLIANSPQTVLAKNLTIDLSGKTLGVHYFRGEDLTLTDSKGSGKFYYRGDGECMDCVQESDLYAPGIPVFLGYGANSLSLTVTGKLTCGTLTANNKSVVQTAADGRILAQSQVGGEPMPVLSGSMEVSEEAELLNAKEKAVQDVRMTADVTLTASAELSGLHLTLAPGVTLHLGDSDLKIGLLTMEDGAKLDAGKGRLTVTAQNNAQVSEQLAILNGLPVIVSCEYPDDTDIAVTFDCTEKVASWPDRKSGTPNRKNMEIVFACAPEGWLLKLNCTLIANSAQKITARNLTIDLNGKSLGVHYFMGENVTLIDSKGNAKFYYRGDGSNTARTQESDVYAPGVNVILGYGSNSVKLTVTGTLTYGTLTCANKSTVTGNLVEAKN